MDTKKGGVRRRGQAGRRARLGISQIKAALPAGVPRSERRAFLPVEKRARCGIVSARPMSGASRPRES
jgi:hypothetical protein